MAQLTRRQCYILAQQRKAARRPVACDVSPLVGTIGHAIRHPIDTVRDPSRLKKEYGRRAGNIYRKSEDLPQVQENNMISIKDIIKHHKTHEDVHRSGYEKFAKSEFHNVKPIAEKHKRLWHHHAGVRTRYEAMDRAGKTHVSQRQYERDSKGRFASFSLSLVDDVVLARPAGYALAARPDRFAKARAVKRQRQVLPRAHYVLPAGNAAAFKFEVEDRFKFINDTSGGSPHKVSLTMQHYPNPDPEDRRQWVLINVETDDVALLHQIDTLAKKWKSRSLNSRGDMSPLEPTARVRKPGTVEAQETTVFTLPEKRGVKFSRDVKKFNGTRTGIKKIVGQNRVVVVVMCPDPATLKLVKQWAASEWGAHEVGMNTFNQAQEMSFAHELRHAYAMGVAGRIAGGIIGGNIGGVIGTIGGPLGALVGTGIGAYAGQRIGHRLQEGPQRDPKKDLERRWAHVEGNELMGRESHAKSLRAKGAPRKGSDGKYSTKDLADHFYRKSALHKSRTEDDDADEAAEIADYFQSHHDRGIARHGAWDESKHPRSHGKFV